MVLSESWVRAVRNKMGVFNFLRISAQAENPLRPGIITSSIIRSNVSSAADAACSPFSASTTWYPSLSSRILTTSLISGSSSANKIFRLSNLTPLFIMACFIFNHPGMDVPGWPNYLHYISDILLLPPNSPIDSTVFVPSSSCSFPSVMLDCLQR